MNEEQILEAALAGTGTPFAARPTCSAYEDHVQRWLATHERKFLAATNGSGELELHVLDTIGVDWWTGGGITAKAIKAKLDANPSTKTIRVLIDSPGGDAFMGIAIQALLKRHAAEVITEVIGEASSAASIVAMSGDKILMHEGAMMMVHRAAGGRWGYASDHRAAADALDGITNSAIDLYVRRTGKDRADVQALVDAETWMTASQAVDKGFADEVLPGKAKVAPAAPAKKTAATNEAATAPVIALPRPAARASLSLEQRALNRNRNR
jgi:ATP-dependent Clp protease protease subunit